MKSSSCNSYEDEWSPFERSQFATAPALDRKLDTKRVLYQRQKSQNDMSMTDQIHDHALVN